MMKSNTFVFMLLTFFLSSNLALQARDMTFNESLDFYGTLDDSGPRSVFPTTLEGSYEGSSIALGFLKQVGEVSIVVTNKVGKIVYDESLNVDAPQVAIISLVGEDNGEYTIVVTGSKGKMTGSFHIQN